jgi:hypothetical protein
MWFRRRPAAPAPAPLTAEGQLALVPVRNARLSVDEDLPDRLILAGAVSYPAWLGPLPRLMKLRTVRRYELTDLGLALWRRLDDQRTLGELIAWLAADQRLTWLEARLLALQYLHDLAGRGLLVLAERKA